MAIRFEKAELFGGAIVARLPSHFIDVSELRQVPDHQEVYMDRDGTDSLLFDITERVDGAVEGGREISSDVDALKYHAEDIIEIENPSITSISTVNVQHLPAQTPSMTCFASSTAAAAGEKTTGILILLIRLIEKKTDVLVTFNLPQLSSKDAAMACDQEDLSSRLQNARAVISEIISSFEIKDWGLFL